jgi:hypothetical protein
LEAEKLAKETQQQEKELKELKSLIISLQSKNSEKGRSEKKTKETETFSKNSKKPTVRFVLDKEEKQSASETDGAFQEAVEEWRRSRKKEVLHSSNNEDMMKKESICGEVQTEKPVSNWKDEPRSYFHLLLEQSNQH